MFVSYGTLDISSFGSISSNAILLISLFLLIGLGTKIGVVPMHSWVPDTYSEAPIPVSAFLAGTVKGASAFILIRLLFSMHPALDVVLLFISVTALLTVGIGAIMAYTQKDLKRFLAYSSIEQAGIILFAIGIGSSAALAGGIFQIVNNMVMKTLLFLCVGAIIAATKRRDIESLSWILNRCVGPLRDSSAQRLCQRIPDPPSRIPEGGVLSSIVNNITRADVANVRCLYQSVSTNIPCDR
jgi:formate hydrogenlyase subunit 3/multisubunit Na+/H+ antiporter MnhD subunit